MRWPFSRRSPVADVAFITRGSINPTTLIAAVSAPERGGLVCFLGTVRCGPDDGPVTRIEYDAYPEMLEREFAKIVDEAESRWSTTRVAAQHRIGPIPLGEASIAIVAAAPHRADAFDACRYVIEEAKRRLPVWKREVLEDGSAAWRDNVGGRSPSRRGPEA